MLHPPCILSQIFLISHLSYTLCVVCILPFETIITNILSVFWNITTYISVILHPLCILKYYYSYLCLVHIILSLCFLKYYYWFLCDYTFSMNSEILLLISLRIIQHSLYSEIFLLISLWSYILSMFWNITKVYLCDHSSSVYSEILLLISLWLYILSVLTYPPGNQNSDKSNSPNI